MLKVLPERIDIARLADSQTTLVGLVPVGRFVRLAHQLAEQVGTVEVELEFGREDGREVIAGRIEGELALVCQRCLGAVRVQVRTTVGLVRVANEADAESVTGTHEPFVAPTREVELAALIEDEVILALPIVPSHESDARCRPVAVGLDESSTKVNPFAALAALKKN